MDPRLGSFRTDNDGEPYLSGWLVPFRGMFPGDKDTYGTRFSKNTDYALSLFGDRPLLFHHGQDEDAGISAVGRIRSLEVKDDGVWMDAWLDRQNVFFGRMVEAAQKGKLFLSSGTLDYLTKINERTGDVEQWPIAEGSCTFTPASPFATTQLSYRSHLEEAGIDLDEAKLKAFESLKTPDDLVRRSFREAVLTFNQEQYVSEDEREAAWQRLVSQALQHQLTLSSTIMPGRSATFHPLAATEGEYVLINDEPDTLVPAVLGARAAGVKTDALRAVIEPVLGVDAPDQDEAVLTAVRSWMDALLEGKTPERSLADIKAEAALDMRPEAVSLRAAQAAVTAAQEKLDLADAAKRAAAETEQVDLERSFEDIRDDISRMINPASPFAYDGCPWSCVIATFPDYVIVERHDDEDCTYWKIPYTLGDDREPVLGTAVEVERSYMPTVRALLSTGPVHAEAVSFISHSNALIERTKDLGERRYREGRVISKANHTILKSAHSKMGEAHEAMGKLLDSVATKTESQARASDPETWKRQALELELELLADSTV